MPKTGEKVVIPVVSNANPVTVDLSAELMKELADKRNVLVVETRQGTLEIPASAITAGTLTDIFGKNEDIKDVKVNITLKTLKGEESAKVTAQVEKTGAKVVAFPLLLDIIAVYGGKSAAIGQLDAYVTLTVPIPEGVDPSKITTAVFVDANGGVHHTPTIVTQLDGKYYAKFICRNAGVPYILVWHPVEFTDVASHWAKEAINDMGSRMVVSGVGNDMFEPDRDITRAEFAAIVVRALGLKPGMGNNPFLDVGASEWYCEYIQTASEYGIISGYGNGKFGPNDKITREQAMTMAARAMKITGLEAGLAADDIDALLTGFEDLGQVASWAKENIAACVKTGIVSGKSDKLLAPKDEITRAEVVVIVRRLLQKSSLI